ncbi:MAG: N-acetyltransferase [Muribaculaceae bacterium]|nr:N-acetyltransferase [Muribaculaceae bacterium]
MSVAIKKIAPVSEQLRQYVQFGIDMYKGNDYYVPPLIFDEVATLSPDKNPAFEHCTAQSFMAYRNGCPAGRITAIINNAVNEKNNERTMRFGFVDFIDDDKVVDALFKAVEEWGRSRGMTKIVGPMGFTDMDHEGMLTEGFEEMGTMATIYNYPYYPEHMERMGYGKEVDWVEYRMTVPDAVPEKYQRIADIVSRKYGLSVKKYTSRKKIKKEYGHALFELINEAYSDLYGYSPLTRRQIEYYIDQYLGVIRLEDVCVVIDANKQLVAVGISMPSLSQALRRCGGKLFPTGWYHLWNAIRGKVDVVDLLLVAVKPEYQSKGVNAMIFADLIPSYIKNGYKYAESNLELEGNESVQKQWEYFERRQHRRRRAWSKNL